MMKQSKANLQTRSFVAALLWMTVPCAALHADEPILDATSSGQIVTTKTVERFVPDTQSRVAAIELRGEASVTGADVTLKQLCRWSTADADAFAEVADLVVLRLTDTKPFDTITIEQLQNTLRDAGVNPGLVNFAGAATCTVSRSDVKTDEGSALRKWVGDATKVEDPKQETTATDEMQANLIAAAARQQANTVNGGADSINSVKTGDLRAQLITDAATRLNIPAASLQVDFKADDRKLLGLAAPFEFSFEPQRYGDLGETSWIVNVGTNGQKQRVRISAIVRAWQEQLVLAKPLNLRQTISESDFEVKRILADKLSRDPLATKASSIGQQASRDLQAGTILTSKMLAPMELVHSGQLVTILTRRGGVEVKSVAVALQNGSAGQAIKVKNELTNQVFPVTLTGPQMATLGGSDPVAAAE